jgi:hypothetical protein
VLAVIFALVTTLGAFEVAAALATTTGGAVSTIGRLDALFILITAYVIWCLVLPGCLDTWSGALQQIAGSGSSVLGNQPECTAIGNIAVASDRCPEPPRPTEEAAGAAQLLPGTIPSEWTRLAPDVRDALLRAGITEAVLRVHPEMKIYRVHGGCSGEKGKSWTPIPPLTIEALGKGTFRDLAGLPDCNTGEWIAEGVMDTQAFVLRLAIATVSSPTDRPGGGGWGLPGIGGLPEIYFFSPQEVDAWVHNVKSKRAVPPL